MDDRHHTMTRPARIFLLDDDPAGDPAAALRNILQSSSPDAEMCRHDVHAGARDLSSVIRDFNPDLIFFVLARESEPEAETLFQTARSVAPDASFLAIVEGGKPDELIRLLELGFDDFITPPFKAADVVPRVNRLLERARLEEPLTRALKEKLGLRQLVGESAVFLEEIRKIPPLAKCDANVMLSGETGTGKELCARAVHYLSPRASGPFVPVNCGAVPVELVENELFGHERGAYTGASSAQDGLVQESDGGTLFLDEIDSLPLLAQVKLLRFLQEKEYRPLGSTKTRKANVRVIAATNADLDAALNTGRLRRDLFYRLNVISLRLPPLRERREDIPLLARHFLAKYADEFDKRARDYALDALHALVLYDWPGNVRELQHVVERAVVLSERRVVCAADIQLPRGDVTTATTPPASFKEEKSRVIEQFERGYLLNVLRVCGGNITRAASLARKNRRAFFQLIRRYGIDPKTFRQEA